MLALGTEAPDFALTDEDGTTVVSRSDFTGQPLLMMFLCNHCPFVVHVADELARIGREYGAKGVGIVAINTNDIEKYPDDAPEKMKQEKARRGYTFPYLYDASQSVAKSYTAVCTPDLFLFDADHKLAYRGQLDETRPSSGSARSGFAHSTRCGVGRP